MRVIGLGPIVLTVCTTLAFTSCSSATDRAPAATTGETSVQSFACIEAVSMTALNTGSLVRQARSTLQRLADDSTLTDEQREYFADLLSVLASKTDTEVIGNALDDVPCQLK